MDLENVQGVKMGLEYGRFPLEAMKGSYWELLFSQPIFRRTI